MVLPDSRRVPRAPRYLGYRFESVELSLTWLSHSMADLSRSLQLAHGLVTLLTRPCNPRPCTQCTSPPHPCGRGCGPCTPCSAGFRLFRFRSPLLSESRLFSFPPGTEMVHFPGFASLRPWIQRRISGVQPEG